MGFPYLPATRSERDELARVIADAVARRVAAERFPRPTSSSNPRRAISARAGVTLYQVRGVKTQPGGRTFVAVDGGMSDNPGYRCMGEITVALPIAILCAQATVHRRRSRHCESGDEIARDVELPADVHPGDLARGGLHRAYHHSMASNYTWVGPSRRSLAVKDGWPPRIGPARNDRGLCCPAIGLSPLFVLQVRVGFQMGQAFHIRLTRWRRHFFLGLRVSSHHCAVIDTERPVPARRAGPGSDPGRAGEVPARIELTWLTAS